MRLGVWVGLSLLLVGDALPAAVDAEADPSQSWSFEDGSGDVTVGGQPSDLGSHLDILKLSIDGEDELAFWFVVTLAQLKVASEVPNVAGYGMSVVFNVEGVEPPFRMTASLYGARSSPASPDFLWTRQSAYRICHRSDSNCLWQTLVMDEDAKSIKFYVRKDRVEGLMQPPRSGPPAPSQGPITPPQREVFLRVGTKFYGFTVSFQPYGSFGGLPGTDPAQGDRVPDEGVVETPYPLRLRTANQEIMVLLGGAYFYAPGDLQTVEFRIVNYAAAKRLIRLSYNLTGPGADQYAIKGPNNLSIPAGQTRTFTFDLQAPAQAAPTELRIRADALPLGEVGLEVSNLAPGVPLGPQIKELRVLRPDPAVYEGNPYCFVYECSAGLIMSGPAPVGGYVPGGEVYASPTQWQYGFRVWSRPAPAYPFTLDKGGQVEVDVSLSSMGVAQDNVPVRANLVYFTGYSTETLLDSNKEFTIDTTPTPLVFKGAARTKAAVLTGQGTFFLRIDLPMNSMVTGGIHKEWKLDLAATKVMLPLGPLPTDYLVKPAPTPFRLRAVGDREDFVNPGEARLFNVSVYNQDSLEQRARIEFRVPNPEWSGEVLPGREFNLKPGDSVTLGALLRAPAAAVDGQSGSMLVSVLSDTGAVAELNLTAIVIVNKDFSDDLGRFEADEDDLDKFASTPKARAPSLAMHATLALLAVAALALRRGSRG